MCKTFLFMPRGCHHYTVNCCFYLASTLTSSACCQLLQSFQMFQIWGKSSWFLKNKNKIHIPLTPFCPICWPQYQCICHSQMQLSLELYFMSLIESLRISFPLKTTKVKYSNIPKTSQRLLLPLHPPDWAVMTQITLILKCKIGIN